MRGDILDRALADHPDLAPVAQRLAILGAGSQARTSSCAPSRRGSPARCDRWSRACRARARRAARSACMTAFITAGSAPTHAGLAGALGAERVALGRHRVADDPHAAHVVGARHAVIHEACRQQLAGFRFVDHLLHQDLADALRHAAMDLPGQGQRIDHRADVIDDQIGLQRRPSPVSGSISTSQTWQPFGKVSRVRRIGARARRSRAPCPSAAAPAGTRRVATCFSVTPRSVPATAELAVGELDVGLRRFQQMRGDAACPCRSPSRAASVSARAADHHRA